MDDSVTHKRATIRDVARECGVSVTTVSVVLNNSPRPVREEVRQRVIEVARRLDYHPSAVARGLVRQKTNCIGILLGAVGEGVVGDYYAAGVLSGVIARAEKIDFDLHFFTTRWVSARDSAARVRAGQPDGVLVLAPEIGSDMPIGLREVGLPVVCISTPDDPLAPYVDVDNAVGATLAANHLLSLGHRKIAHLCAGPSQRSGGLRRDAFLTTLSESGVKLTDRDIVGNTFDRDEGYAAAWALLRSPDRPTAIFAANDSLALQVLHAARDLGIRVPEQLSIVGFDDFPVAPLLNPPLTTLRQPLVQIGEAAVRLLLRLVEGRTAEQRRLVLPELIVRGSTAPPKTGG